MRFNACSTPTTSRLKLDGPVVIEVEAAFAIGADSGQEKRPDLAASLGVALLRGGGCP
jgi:hypothetical protein